MDKTLKYEKGDWKTETVDGVVNEWPFIEEAIGQAEEVEADRIQEAMERCFENGLISDHARLGFEIMNQVKKYISEVKAIREE